MSASDEYLVRGFHFDLEAGSIERLHGDFHLAAPPPPPASNWRVGGGQQRAGEGEEEGERGDELSSEISIPVPSGGALLFADWVL